MNAKHLAAQAVNIRQSETPPIMPACRNCQHHTYDAGERMGARGETARRCIKLAINVTTRLVCDLHTFRHADRRDV